MGQTALARRRGVREFFCGVYGAEVTAKDTRTRIAIKTKKASNTTCPNDDEVAANVVAAERETSAKTITNNPTTSDKAGEVELCDTPLETARGIPARSIKKTIAAATFTIIPITRG
jgi:hypothetical protein